MGKLIEKLEECAAPFKLADSEKGQISFEELVREFSIRQQAASNALALARQHQAEQPGDCEMRVIQDEFEKARKALHDALKAYNLLVERNFHKLYQPEPVFGSVSLGRCAKAAFDAYKPPFDSRELAKAVLDAAGVKYVD